MEVRLLGPVEVWAGGRVVDAGAARQRCVLAALAVDAGRPVPVETLLDRVWGEDPPARARHALYVYVTRIRKLLAAAGPQPTGPVHGGGPLVLRRGGGYLLAADPEQVDVVQFRRLVAQARDLSCPAGKRAELLGQALDLWRGVPLADLSGQWPARMRRAWLDDRLDAAVGWGNALASGGDAAAAVAPLTELADEHPLNEALAGALMRVLHAVGRGADALALFAGLRERLAERLGADPGPELRAIHEALVRGQAPPGEADGRRAPTRPGPVAWVPAQLPADVAGFTGRRDVLARLDAMLAGGASTAVVITAVSGTAGVGKTAVAVHWAHAAADRFPDGQLYVNLRGFDAAGAVMAPEDALRGFLDALGVPPDQVPRDFAAQAALYRSLLAGRRVLILLDNARDAEQVRPLLPGTPTAAVLVTSRNQLTALVAAVGAEPVTLDLLTPVEARELLARRLGDGPVAAEPAAVDQIVAACARLPLALAIAAARARQTRFPLAVIAAELRRAGERLDVLDAGDPTSQVRAVFSWSYVALPDPAARLLRLLGLHPGPDITVPAAASLAALPRRVTRRLLAELVRANLVVEHSPGRYASHDLLRAYAAEQAQAYDTADERRAAHRRLLDHYLHTAYAATRLINPFREPIALADPRPGVRPEPLAGPAQAYAWFGAERRVLVAAVEHAAAAGFDAPAWQLAWAVDEYSERTGRWHDELAVSRAAVTAAHRLADPAAQARAHRLLGRAHLSFGRLAECGAELGRALDLFRQAGERVGEAYLHLTMSILHGRRRAYAAALDHPRLALGLFRAAGDRRGQAKALNMVGWIHAVRGDHEHALVCGEQALALFQEVDDRMGEADTWDTVGYAHHHLGRNAEAVGCYRRALDIYRSFADRPAQAFVLVNIGDSRHAAGDVAGARAAWREALTIFEEHEYEFDDGRPGTDSLRAKLAGVEEPGA